MKRCLPCLFFIFPFLALSSLAGAQCGFPAAIAAGKGYCTNSPLWISSTHGLQSITWYQDGRQVKTATASQSLDPTGTIAVAWTGSGGSETDQIIPCGLFVDENNNLYVSDFRIPQVKKYPPGGGIGTIVAGGHGFGSAANQFQTPTSLFVDKQNNLFVFDGENGRVQKWAPGDSTGTTVGLLPTGDAGLAFGLYVDCAGNVYACDGSSVLKFTPGSTTGTIVAGGHGQGNADNQLNFSSGLSLDTAGNIFVSDQDYRVVEWKPGASAGITVAGGHGIGFAGNQMGTMLWMDGKNNMYLGDNGASSVNSRVAIWPLGNASGTTILGAHGDGKALNQFGNGVFDLKEDLRGNVFVSDQANYRVLEFKRTLGIDSTYTPGATGQYWAVVTDIRGYTQTTDTITVISSDAPPSTISITASATSTPVCTPITFSATAANAGANPNFQWEVSGVKVGTDSSGYSNNLFANGDQVDCILTSKASCSIGPGGDTSNIITLGIDPNGAATVAITASDTAICQGVPVVFKATVTNGAAQPGFQWLVNGLPVPGDDSAAYHSDSLTNGNVITCLITSDDACGLAKSNSVPMAVSVPPVIIPNQVVTIPYGKSTTLNPEVTGNISSWLWTPGTGLSDSTIEDPVADPASTTLYTLKVTAAGCGSDTGAILVNVFTPLSLPNAFTPNGDGHNDIFYVLTGPANSKVENFAVYNRWGQAVFQAHDAAPGDPATGWNGFFHGRPAEPGTYVYIVVMKYADGSRQTYRGTVILIR